MLRLDSTPPLYLDAGLRLDSNVLPPAGKYKMAQLALALRHKTEQEKIDLGAIMAKALADNPTVFVDPKPTGTQVLAAGAALRAQGLVVSELEAQLNIERAKYEELDAVHDGLLTALGKFFELVAKGVRAILALTGAPIKGEATPIGNLPAPGNLRVSLGDKPGENDLIWDAVNGSMVYIAQYSTAVNGPWLQGYLGTASRCTLTALTSGQEYYFQVCAVGTAGQGPWSDIARRRAA